MCTFGGHPFQPCPFMVFMALAFVTSIPPPPRRKRFPPSQPRHSVRYILRRNADSRLPGIHPLPCASADPPPSKMVFKFFAPARGLSAHCRKKKKSTPKGANQLCSSSSYSLQLCLAALLLAGGWQRRCCSHLIITLVSLCLSVITLPAHCCSLSELLQ